MDIKLKNRPLYEVQNIDFLSLTLFMQFRILDCNNLKCFWQLILENIYNT